MTGVPVWLLFFPDTVEIMIEPAVLKGLRVHASSCKHTGSKLLPCPAGGEAACDFYRSPRDRWSSLDAAEGCERRFV